MRILIATPHRSVVGGVETHLQSLIPALVEAGHDIGVVCEQNRFDGAEVVDSGADETPVWCCQDLETSAMLREISDWSPDLVYSHCPESQHLEAALLSRYPCILHIHNYWGTCISSRKCHDFPRASACDRELGPACLALYHTRRCGGLNPLTALRMFRTQAARLRQLGGYRRIVVSSSHMYGEYERHRVSPEKLRLIHYPVTDAGLESEPFAPKPPGDSLLFVGRLTNLKGADYLIRAIPQAAQHLGRTLGLTVIGDGPERSQLEQLAKRLNVQSRFLGWLNGDDKLNEMRESSLLVVPSRWPEPFGLVGIEAGCLSVPAAGFALGGIPDWLVPGLTGELALGDPPTVEGLTGAIVAALKDPEHYARLQRGAWESSRQFTMKRHLTQLEDTMNEALHRKVAVEVSVGI